MMVLICNVPPITQSHVQLASRMELSPASEANSRLAIQETSTISYETEGSLPCSQESTTGRYPQPDESIPPPPILLL
jgi:hypothetical protein